MAEPSNDSKPPMKFFIAFFLLVLTALPLWSQPRAESRKDAGVQVVSSTDKGVVLKVTDLAPRIVSTGGRTQITTTAPGHTYADSGALPVVRFEIAVPHGVEGFRATLANEGASAVLPVTIDGSFRSPRPSALSVGTPILRRGFRVLPVYWVPFRMEGGSVRYTPDVRITIGWSGRVASAGSGAKYNESRQMESILAGSILNFSSARQWYRPAKSSVGIQSASGWGMGEAMVLAVPANGIYRVTGAELEGAGASGIIGVPVAQLGISNRREPVPFFLTDDGTAGIFDRDDIIEFAGERNQDGDGLYLSEVTDTNAYVLKWDGSIRASSIAQSTPAAQPVRFESHDSTLRFELDDRYYPGHSEPPPEVGGWGDVRSVHVTERVAEERFYWKRMASRAEERFYFDCAPMYQPDGTTTMRIMFAGATSTPHRIQVLLNESGQIGIAEFDGQMDSLFTFTFQTSLLVNGRNSLKLVSNEPEFPVQYTYLDYFELTGAWQTSFAGEVDPRFTLPVGVTGPARIELTGLRAPVSTVLSERSRGTIESNERGHLFRLSSRRLEKSGMRIMPGFVAESEKFTVATPPFTGAIVLLEVDPASGDTVGMFSAPTNEGLGIDVRIAAYRGAADFVRKIRAGNLLLAGFSIGFGSIPAEAAADAQSLKTALTEMGSSEMNRGDLNVSSWTFVAIKGDPSSAQERFASLEENNTGIAYSYFHPATSGSTYRARLQVEGVAGEEFQTGSARQPGQRYHREDLLTGADNAAELLIITHPKFVADANRLAEHRRTRNNMQTRVVDIYSIYDEFNDGIKSPMAIRHFLQYADTNWTAGGTVAAPGFVVLFGDGTWDPMKRNSESIMEDYIPAYGVPTSDYIYTVPFDDPNDLQEEDLYWSQLIGRLPAISVEDARAMVDKLIEYDTLTPAAWNKRFVYLAGGGKASEIDQNVEFYTMVMENYITSALFGGDTALVQRTSPNPELPDAIDAARARGEINKGALWVSFSGHGSTNVVDLDFGYPEDLDIGNRYFVLGTFSCRTGDFAVPGVKPRNEYFLTAPRSGSIAAIGSTGYSYSDINELIEIGMYSALTSPPFKTNLGEIFTDAKTQMFELKNNGTGTPGGTRARNHLLQYTLLGDPSMNLVLSPQVELALPAERAMFASETGNELNPADSFAILTAQLWNHGRPVAYNESVMVVATIINPKREEFRDTVVVDSVTRYRDISFTLPLMQEPGEYTVRIEADPIEQFEESVREDNTIVLTLPIRGNQPLPIEPLPFGRVASYDAVVIHLLNPSTGPGADIIVDTTADFSSPSPISSRATGSIDTKELTTTWSFSIPSGWRSARTFWYKAVATSGDPDAAARFPLIESFTVDSPAAEFVLSGEKQMRSAEVVNLVNDATGVGPGSRIVPIEVRGMGQSHFDNGAVIPNVRAVFRADGRNLVTSIGSGINLVVLPPNDVTPRTVRAFAFWSTPSPYRDFIDFVRDSIQPGDRVLMATNGVSFDYPSADTAPQLQAEIFAAMESIGVRDPGSIEPKDSYAMIGGKGVPASEVRIHHIRKADQSTDPPYEAIVLDTFSVIARQGYLATPTVGPATAWRELTLTLGESGLAPDLTIFGIRRDGRRDSLMRTSGSARVDLSSIDPLVYPRIDLRADFASDSALRLRSIGVDFDPSPELALLPSALRFDVNSVLQGDPAQIVFAVVNLSRRYAANNVGLRLSSIGDDALLPLDSAVIALIPPQARIDTSFALITDRMPESIRFQIMANQADNPSEPYRQNNVQASGPLNVKVDTESPSIAVYADGNRLMYGDFVAPGATFEFRMFDNSKLKLDSSAIKRLVFDNEVIVAGADGLLQFKSGGAGGASGTFFYKPPTELEDGEHYVQVHSIDATGNINVSEPISFTVERDLRIDRVVNVPNPFAERTVFTFMIGGGSVPTGGEIGIFTLAGRKVKAIPLSPVDINIGFNRIEWNGLDEDGDRMANGVYFYRLRIDQGDNRVEVLEKLVIMK